MRTSARKDRPLVFSVYVLTCIIIYYTKSLSALTLPLPCLTIFGFVLPCLALRGAALRGNSRACTRV